jgi:hypothetical protein
MQFTEMDDFPLHQVQIFYAVESRFICFFQKNFTIHINHCTKENKLFLMNLIEGIMTIETAVDGGLQLNQVVIAILFAFYALVLLEVHGDNVSIEEMCRMMNMRSDTDSVRKIKEIYYEIAWGDDPLFAEVRGRMLMPERYKVNGTQVKGTNGSLMIPPLMKPRFPYDHSSWRERS